MEWQMKRKGFTRNLPFYEVRHKGNRKIFSGKTKAIAYAKSIGYDLFNPHREQIDIINTQTGEITKFQ